MRRNLDQIKTVGNMEIWKMKVFIYYKNIMFLG